MACHVGFIFNAAAYLSIMQVVMFRGMRNLGRQIADMVDNQGYALLKAVNLEAGWWNEEKQLQIDDHSIMHFWSADLHDLQHQAPAALEHIRERHVHELVGKHYLQFVCTACQAHHNSCCHFLAILCCCLLL
jgi:hypothetical protein